MKGIYLIIISCLLYTSNFYAQNYIGTAFIDSNGNGNKEVNEKGLAGILISDGLNFVKTDENGTYTIDGFKDFHFIMAHIPADYKTKNYYHKIKENKRVYDFAFTPKAKTENFQFVHVSDTETYEFRDWLNVLKDYVKNESPAFIMHTGDICYKRGMAFHGKNINSKTMGTPMRYSVGNHDLVAGDYGEQFYEQQFGPVYYSFEQGNVLFISTPMLSGDYKPMYTKKQVYNWLKNLLALFPKDQPKVIYNHDLLTEGEQFIYGINEKEQLNLNEHNLKAWVYGHFHNNNIKVHGNSGIKSICTASPVMGGIDHSPSMFRVINVDAEGNMETQLRYTSLNKHIEVVTPKMGQLANLVNGKLPISINTYHSASETVKVRYAIDSLGYTINWHDLTKKESWQEMKQASDFNFTANWKAPDNAEGKMFVIRVQAFLKNGQVIRTKENFVYKSNVIPVETAKDWRVQLLNANHTGDPNREIKSPLSLQWINNAGSNIFMSSPVVAENKVFVACMDDNNYINGAIVAFNAKTGSQIWRYKTEGSVKNSIAYSNGAIIATDSKGITYAINGNSGKLVWKTDLNSNKMPPFVSGITAKDGVVYTGFGTGLSALDAKTGDFIWKNKDWYRGEGSVPTLTIANDVLIASAQWVSLFGHNVKTGKLLWKRKDQSLNRRDGSTTFKDNVLYAPSRKAIVILDPKTGKTIKHKETSFEFNVSASPLVTDELLILATGHNGLVAFNKKSLEVEWIFNTKAALIYTAPYTKTNEHTVEGSPVLSGNTIYFGASDGYFYGVDVTTGIEQWTMNLGAPVFSTVAISGDLIYINDFAGNVYAFRSNIK